jgi:hypothetical protein
VVVLVAILSAGVGALHFLVRPHLWTLAFLLITLRLCQSQHEKGGWSVFLAAPLTAVWANLHGGFLAGPFVVFTAMLGHAVSGPWEPARRQELAKFAAAGVLCLVAALVNPYGWDLYRHVGRLLVSSGVTELIEEYQPVPFGKPYVRSYEWVLLALIAVPTLTAGRMSRYELVHALAWLHLSLASVRHAPLFGLAVAPGLARMLDRGKTASNPEQARGLAAWSAWPALGALAMVVSVPLGVTYGEFTPLGWPLAALPSVNAAPAADRLFHEQDWGGLIAAECLPPRPTFIDDRFELYGKPGVLRYVNALEGGPDWDGIRDRDDIRLVWVRPDRGLARRLDADPSWRVRFRDKVSVLFEKQPPGPEIARTP